MALITLADLPPKEQSLIAAILAGMPPYKLKLLSYGWTEDYLPPKGPKDCTRRNWKDCTLAHWQRGFDAGRVWHRAISKNLGWGGKDIGLIRLKERPHRQFLAEMPDSDLVAEGGMVDSVSEFIDRYFDGNSTLNVAVIRFDFLPLPSTSEQSEAFALINPPAQLSLL